MQSGTLDLNGKIVELFNTATLLNETEANRILGDSGTIIKADLLNENTVRVNNLQQDNQQTIYFAVETMYDFI